MINSISGSSHIVVSNMYSSQPYVDSSKASAGMVRYHNSNFEVYDGSTWMTISGSYPSIDLSGNAISAINWALEKMSQEREQQDLAKTHPAVANAIEAVKRAEEQLHVIVQLTKEHGEDKVESN